MKKCFVISPIGKEGTEIREHADDVFEYIIKPALEGRGIKPIRSDHLLEPGKITDQMYREIFSSDLCVAVLTGQNPNVFYELAIAQASRRPVIVLLNNGEELPFDIHDLRCVVYDLKPRSLFERQFVEQLAGQIREIERRNWVVDSPFDRFLQMNDSAALPDRGQIEQTDEGYCIRRGRLSIQIVLGRIEQTTCDDNGLIVLPANEFFDDECVHDSRSALGAYLQYHFSGEIEKIQEEISDALANVVPTEVEKEPGIFAQSYGVGRCIYLGQPASSQTRLALVAVTSKRAGKGLLADARSVLDSIHAIHRTMVDHRLAKLVLPLIGSGHGGLTREASLMTMLTALSDVYRQPSGRKLESIKIVIFQRSPGVEPSISRDSIRLALLSVPSLFSE